MANLADCCLADAVCAEARFEGAYFRQTIVAGGNFAQCSFSCPSILAQPLSTAGSLAGAVYWHKGEYPCSLEKGVTRIECAGHTIVGMDGRLIVNGRLLETHGKQPVGPYCDGTGADIGRTKEYIDIGSS